MGNEQQLSGLMVGMIAASIDIVTNWLGDLKDGFCRPSFYLSKAFCCWQIDGRRQFWIRHLAWHLTMGNRYITMS